MAFIDLSALPRINATQPAFEPRAHRAVSPTDEQASRQSGGEVRFETVAKTFATAAGPLKALEGISFEVGSGEIFGVIGRSGAGKSTLIRLINGLERPSTGRVLVDGIDIGGLPQSGNAESSITLPDAHLLFSGHYERYGKDLIISNQTHHFVVPNYFHGDKRPLLVSPDGAPLDSAFVAAMTGHAEYAQAGGNPAAKVVGHVAKMTGAPASSATASPSISTTAMRSIRTTSYRPAAARRWASCWPTERRST